MQGTDDLDARIVRRRREIGDRLRILRVWRNLSQEGLGNAIGVDRGTIIRMEAGSSSFLVDQAIKIEGVLKIPLTWLFSDDWTRPDGSSDTPGGGRGVEGG